MLRHPEQYAGQYIADPTEPDHGSPGRINTSKARISFSRSSLGGVAVSYARRG